MSIKAVFAFGFMKQLLCDSGCFWNSSGQTQHQAGSSINLTQSVYFKVECSLALLLGIQFRSSSEQTRAWLGVVWLIPDPPLFF